MKKVLFKIIVLFMMVFGVVGAYVYILYITDRH